MRWAVVSELSLKDDLGDNKFMNKQELIKCLTDILFYLTPPYTTTEQHYLESKDNAEKKNRGDGFFEALTEKIFPIDGPKCFYHLMTKESRIPILEYTTLLSQAITLADETEIALSLLKGHINEDCITIITEVLVQMRFWSESGMQMAISNEDEEEFYKSYYLFRTKLDMLLETIEDIIDIENE